PYTPAPRDASAFPGLAAPRPPAFDQPNVDAPSWLARVPPLSRRDVAGIDTAYRRRAQAVQAVDSLIARVEAALASRGLANDTYVVFSSDNGYHMGEHRLRPGKMSAFDSDIRVPLIVAGPGVPRGRTIPWIAENIVLAPNFIQLPRGLPGPRIDGRR